MQTVHVISRPKFVKLPTYMISVFEGLENRYAYMCAAHTKTNTNKA